RPGGPGLARWSPPPTSGAPGTPSCSTAAHRPTRSASPGTTRAGHTAPAPPPPPPRPAPPPRGPRPPRPGRRPPRLGLPGRGRRPGQRCRRRRRSRPGPGRRHHQRGEPMRIQNPVEVDAPMERVWALVNDIPRVAPCMPGAALTGGSDDTYEGTVAVKLGPLRMSYKGKVTIDEVDDANHSARLTASAQDTKGAGTARATVETRLEPAGETHTRLHVTSDVQLTGKVASFGRGGAINDVATRLFGQFADCLRATLESEATTGPAPAPAVAERSPAPPAPDG